MSCLRFVQARFSDIILARLQLSMVNGAADQVGLLELVERDARQLRSLGAG